MGITYSHKEIKTIIAKIKDFVKDTILCLYNVRIPYLGTFQISMYRKDRMLIYKGGKTSININSMNERLKTCRKQKLKIVNDVGIDT
jgi:nucleoid DNA-binding protein